MNIRYFLTFLVFIFLLTIWISYNTVSNTFIWSSYPSVPSYENVSIYVNPGKRTSLISPNFHCYDDVFLVVVVCSAASNFESRAAIRQTWGQHATSQHSSSVKFVDNIQSVVTTNKTRDDILRTKEQYVNTQRNIQIYFLLGRSSNMNHNNAVANENKKYSDIIQEDFLDTYNNLTLKSVMLLKWVEQNCGHAKYVMKTDDDMFVNLPNLVTALEENEQHNLLLGCFLNDSVPNRDQSSKHYAPENMFANQEYYPPYLSGTGYVFSGDTVPGLFQAALKVEFFHLEDVFITGMCASKIGLLPRHDGRFLFQDGRKKDCCTFQNLITDHKNSPKKLLEIWQACFQNGISKSSCPSNGNGIFNSTNSTNFMIIFFITIVLYIYNVNIKFIIFE